MFRSADELVLILSYIVTFTEVPHLFSELNFIDDFIDEFSLNAEAGFCMTVLETALTFLKDFDLTQLGGSNTNLTADVNEVMDTIGAERGQPIQRE